MIRTSTSLLVFCLAINSCCIRGWGQQVSDTTSFHVGQRWTYEHTGPRIGSLEPEIIDGERIRQVISAPDETSDDWVIEETYTNSETGNARLFVNAEGLLTAIEFSDRDGKWSKLTYVPPIPYQVTPLEIGEEKTFESELRFEAEEYSLQTSAKFRRLENETVETAAGRFENCQRFQVTGTSTFDIKVAKIPVVEDRDFWYHPDANGIVKEVYRKEPIKFMTWSKDGYTATSELSSMSQAEPSAVVENLFSPSANQPTRPTFIGKWLSRILWIAGPIFAVAIGIRFLRRRKPSQP